MKRIILSVIAAAGLIYTAQAQVPGTLSYQGILVNSSGDPVTDGAHYVQFRFYDAVSAGNLKYSSLGTGSGNQVDTYKGMFTFIIGSGSTGNTAIPTNIWDTPTFVEVTADGAVLAPRVTITTTGYAFKAENANSMSAAGLTGSANLPNTVLDADLQDLADGSLSGSKVGTGISATNVTTGTLPNAVLDADLQDLADGSLSGSLVGTGISATNVTTGTLTGSLVGTGINATNISTGTLADARLEATVDINVLNVGSAAQFGINGSGNITKINNVATSFPGAQGGANSFLSNNGSGTLSWATSLAGSQVGTGISATNVTTGTLPLSVFPASVSTGAGANAQVAFWTGSNTQSGSANLYWDNSNARLGIGGTPLYPLNVFNTVNLRAVQIDHDYAGASTQYGLTIDMAGGTGTGSKYGIDSNVYGTAASSGSLYGLETDVVPSSTGTGAAYGINSVVSAGGSGTRYGTYTVAYSGTSGASSTYGVYSYAASSSGSTGNVYGVYSSAANGGGTGTHYAGYFVGNVHVSGTLSKSSGTFKIDHPLDPAGKYLSHSFVESPEMMNVYNGNIVTDGQGLAVVELPAYFEALNKDFRYQLTVIKDFAQAIVYEEINGNKFTIRTDKPNIKVSWQVTGVRQDAWAIQNPIQVEEEKKDAEKGRYLNPTAFGRPEDQGIHFKPEPKIQNLSNQE